MLMGPALATAGETVSVPPASVASPAAAQVMGATELVIDSGGFLSEVMGLAFSPDGRFLAGAGEKEVRVWDVASGELVTTLRGQRDKSSFGNCYSVAFSPDGRYLVVGIDSHTADGSMRVYRTGRWGEIDSLLAGHGVPVRNLAFSPDGQYLVSAGDNGQFLIWQWETRRILSRVAAPTPEQPLYYYVGFPTAQPMLLANGVTSVSLVLVPDGTLAGPGTAIPEELRRWVGSVGAMRYPFGAKAFARSSLRLGRGTWLASGSGGAEGRRRYWAAFWSGPNAEPQAVYSAHTYEVSAVDLSPDGELAASADFFGDIHLWETRTGRARHIFRARGRPVYRAGFGESVQHWGFTNTPYPPGEYDRNHFGNIDRLWQFDRRRLAAAQPPSTYRTEAVSSGSRRLQAELTGDVYYLASIQGDAIESRYRFVAGTMPMSFGLLPGPRLGLDPLVVVGNSVGGLFAYDPGNRHERRYFIGHDSQVSSVGDSPDGRFLISGSTDRTVRVWSLEGYRANGWFDFRCVSNSVIEVEKGGAAEGAGVAIGDKLISVDGRNMTEIERMLLDGSFPYKPGQEVRFDMQRGGTPYQVTLRLRDGADAVSPLLSLLLADDDTWVIWTPQGYYDASVDGDRLIGWHVNQGPTRAAKFYPVHQFRKVFRRPGVIDRVLETGDVSLAFQAEETGTARPREFRDGRREEHLARIEPPQVRILAPEEGTQISTPQITLRAEIASPNSRPITGVTVLVNGRPAKEKSVSVDPAAEARGRQRSVIAREMTLTPGENTISVLASNSDSISPAQTVRVFLRKEARPERVQGSLYIVAMGVSKYKNSGPAVPSLDFAHLDAQAFVETWKRQQGVFYRKVESQLLIDEQATAANLRDAMEWLGRAVTQHDIAMLFFSGHGVCDDRRNYYLGNYELDPKRLRGSAVPSSEINALVAELPCKVIVFADTCHSAGITGSTKAVGDDPWQEIVAEEVGAILFASSSLREKSQEKDEWGHGAFTKALLDAMNDPKSDHNASGFLEVTELDDQVSTRVKELTNGAQHPITAKPPTVRNIPLARVAVP